MAATPSPLSLVFFLDGGVWVCASFVFYSTLLLLVKSKALDEAPYKLSGAVVKLACINLLKFGFLLLFR
jgi:hypothetical protein